jgi:hypothetical protein
MSVSVTVEVITWTFFLVASALYIWHQLVDLVVNVFNDKWMFEEFLAIHIIY